jgi:hypothetical protein
MVRDKEVTTREKKGRLEVQHIPDIESLVDAVDGVHYIVIPSSTAGVHLISQLAALRIGQRYSTPFAASTSTGLSICHQPGPANVSPHQLSSLSYISLVSAAF